MSRTSWFNSLSGEERDAHLKMFKTDERAVFGPLPRGANGTRKDGHKMLSKPGSFNVPRGGAGV